MAPRAAVTRSELPRRHRTQGMRRQARCRGSPKRPDLVVGCDNSAERGAAAEASGSPSPALGARAAVRDDLP